MRNQKRQQQPKHQQQQQLLQLTRCVVITVQVLILLVGSIQQAECFSPCTVPITTRTTKSLSSFNKYSVDQSHYDNNPISSSKNTFVLNSSNNKNNNNNNDDTLNQMVGKYTTKQRLREEVESPFRTVRLFLFGSSTVSALIALYFSTLNVIKAITFTSGTTNYVLEGPSYDDSVQSCIINIIAVLACGAITYRDWLQGDANLQRIAKGGALAKLLVSTVAAPAPVALSTTTSTTTSTPSSSSLSTSTTVVPLGTYRREARVLIAAGGIDYIQTLCRTLNSDQRSDSNTFVQQLEQCDVIIVPVLLQQDDNNNKQQKEKSLLRVGDTKTCWMNTVATTTESDKNFIIERANTIIVFPSRTNQWDDYLCSEIDTAQNKQNVNVLDKGIIILVKKNGRILRRATGQPPLYDIISTMDVMDSNQYGMPSFLQQEK